MLLVVGLLVAVLANIDTVSVTHVLWVNGRLGSLRSSGPKPQPTSGQ